MILDCSDSEMMCVLSDTNRLLFGFVLGPCALDCVSLSILLEVGLGIAVNTEVGKNSLIATGLGLADVCHLDGLLSQLPLVPTIVRVDILLDEMKRGLNALINHEFVLDASFHRLIDQTQLHLPHSTTTFLKESSILRK